MKPLPTPEDPAAVQAALTAVPERPAVARRVHVWECARCGDDRKTEAPPPTPRLCPRCAAKVLEMHTEPATPKRYGDDEDDGEPLELPPAWRSSAAPPVAREPIQADTPVAAPAYPNGERAVPTVAAEEGEVGMAKVETKKGAQPTLAEPWKCDRDGCDFTAATAQGRGVHLLRAHGIKGASNGARSWAAAKAAAKVDAPKPGPAYKCETCGKGFTSASALGGHRNTHTSAKAKREAESPAPAPVADAREEAALDALIVAAMRFPGKEIPEPPSLRCLVVRVRGAVPLEVECATPEDAAAFVRLVAGTPGAKTEARG